MAKPSKSQWDFGELFSPEALASTRKVLSVTELTAQVRGLLESQIGQVFVAGEVSNLKAQASGHIYFSLKDAQAQVSCVLFRGEFQVDRSLLQDGRNIVVRGEMTVYEARGQYQLRVLGVEQQGPGALQIAFEKLKQKLSQEGLFAAERKRPLPRYPERIGLVTSPTGAAIRDVLHVVKRRNPGLEIILAPCRVQGAGAAQEVAAAIRLLNEFHARVGEMRSGKNRGQRAMHGKRGLDLILVTRGGGSLEDLWAFNEETVARAIFESELPVVSAIGHEIDFTISDFVADVRAATPSAAAEIITEGVFSSCQFISRCSERLLQLVRQELADKEYVLEQARQRLSRQHPRRKLNEWLQRLDEAHESMLRCLAQNVRARQTALQNWTGRLARVRPALLLKQRRELLLQEEVRLREQMRHQLEQRKRTIEMLAARLRLLGPEQVLARGYSITEQMPDGKVVRAAEQVKPGQQIVTRLASGRIVSVVEKRA